MPYSLMSVVGGSFTLGAGPDGTECGAFDLCPKGPPQSVPGHPVPEDWSTATRAVHFSPLVLDVTVRRADSTAPLPVDLVAGRQLGVRLSMWSKWPHDFGPKASSVIGAQRRWGPELMSRLASTGAARVNLSWWCRGTRFIGVELVGWTTLEQPSESLAVDWRIHERLSWRSDDSAWPVSHLADTSADALAPIASSGTLLGMEPTAIAMVNHHLTSPLSVLVEREIGPVRVVVTETELEAGQRAVVAELAPQQRSHGLLVSARLTEPGTSGRATVTFAGRHR